uniref:PD-(D/E)XK nuclease family protein n=1 Tax=Segatella copri TaxID=165179 RepID=UPI003FEDBCD1
MVKKLTVKRIDEIQNILNEVYCLKCSIIDTLFEYLETIHKMRVEAGIDKHYATNILNILNPTEPLVSKILCSFLSFTQNGKFCLWRSFTEKFLSHCGFDKQWVKQPVFSSEENRIDILVKEQSYAVIVENKIHDAIFQRNQLARYINVTKSLTNEDNVFIVLLPYESSDGYIEDIPDSVWRLPCDWKVSNNERKCALRGDSTLCACDIENLSENKQKEFKCKDCINFKEHYLNRTKVLDNSFLDWLDQEIENASADAIMQSAMILFSDYLKGIRHLRNKDMFIMCVTKYLRDKLFLKEDTVSEKLKKISEMNESVIDLKNGLEKLAVTYSENLIDEWYKLFEEWYNKLQVKGSYALTKNTPTSFNIEINDIQIGCWSGKDNQNPQYFKYPLIPQHYNLTLFISS